MISWILGSGAADGVPAYGCNCDHCSLARRYSNLKRKTTSLLVSDYDSNILIDVGFDVSEYIDRLDIQAILLTHWHYDHISGLFRLRYAGRKIPLYAPKRGIIEEMIKAPVNLDIRFVDPFTTRIEIGNFEITPIKLIHRPHQIDTFGYIIFNKSEKVTIGILFDTKGLPDETYQYLNSNNIKIDLGFIDATNPPERDVPTHNNLNDVIRISERLKIEKTTLMHIAHYNLSPDEMSSFLKSKGNDREYIIGFDDMIIKL